MPLSAPKQNPIVILYLGLLSVIIVSLSSTLVEALAVIALFSVLALSLGLHPLAGLADARLMLPWALLFFGIHLLFTVYFSATGSILNTAAKESVILARLIGLTFVLGTVRHGMSAQRLIDALKTAADATHLQSRLMEDLLQSISLTLAFIPHVQYEFAALSRFHLALGFSAPKTLRQRTLYFAGNLVPVLSRSLERARQVGRVMEIRGYGTVIPRGQLTPLYFRLSDLLAMGVATMLLGGAMWLA